MPTPIDRNESTFNASGYYDAEAGECVAPAPAERLHTPAAAPAPSQESAGSRAAVDLLVRGPGSAEPPKDCAYPVGEAVVSCAGTVVGAIAGTATGPGALAVLALGGALCGLKVMNARECLE